MNRTIAIAAIVALALAVPLPAMAGAPTGNTLFEWCNKDMAGCRTFFSGMVEGMEVMQVVYEDKVAEYWCWPDGATIAQGADIIIAYIRDNPAERHQPASALGLVALGKAWPCPAK